MANCAYCDSIILSGYLRWGQFFACSDYCQRQLIFRDLGQRFPDEVFLHYTKLLRQRACPRCQRPGPIDLYSSFFIVSTMVHTTRRTVRTLCCRRCAAIMQVGGIMISSIAGWWAMPLGLIFTPIQICHNLEWLLDPPDPSRPSSRLYDFVRLRIAEHSVTVSKTKPYGRPG